MINNQLEAVFQGHTDIVWGVDITSDNKLLVSASFDKTVRIWNLVNKAQEAVLYGHTDKVYRVFISYGNKFIVSRSEDKTLRIWSLLTKNTEAIIKTSDNAMYASGIPSKLKNKIYLCTGFGISTLNIDENRIDHEVFFEKIFEEFYYRDSNFEDQFLPKISFTNS
ncbi:hypothetical protein SteCoe_23799 [Stentor coeruleus]|uniref:Uncharacterized protein n=1 Tax=Stentor coeruleus TaxID=5963 RepID=A0A1R2BJ34_9CILI|nr:hypothetical protein SteCoe_23799 [Stentor coeruleus]